MAFTIRDVAQIRTGSRHKLGKFNISLPRVTSAPTLPYLRLDVGPGDATYFAFEVTGEGEVRYRGVKVGPGWAAPSFVPGWNSGPGATFLLDFTSANPTMRVVSEHDPRPGVEVANYSFHP